MRIVVKWTKEGEKYRRRVCEKYGLPCWETVNGETIWVIDRKTREQLRVAESSHIFDVVLEKEDIKQG